MDSGKREELINRIFELGYSSDGRNVVAVTIDEFFEGNDDESSFGCNIDPHPGMESFYFHLMRFASENEVEVFIEIYEVDEDDEEVWPNSQRVYFVGEVERTALEELMSDTCASDIEELGDFEINGQVYHDVNALWWD